MRKSQEKYRKRITSWSRERFSDQSRAGARHAASWGEDISMMEGLNADEDRQLQRMAARIEQRVFRIRVKRPDRLLGAFRAALRQEGLVRVYAKWSGTDLVFRAELGSRLKRQLHEMKLLNFQDLVDGCTVRAARRYGLLDPRIEDFAVWRRRKHLEGVVRSIPFVVVTRALNKMLIKWAAQRQVEPQH